MTPKSEFGSRVKFFFWKFSLEMIEFILIRNPNEILRVKLSKLGFHFQNFIPYKKQPNVKTNSAHAQREGRASDHSFYTVHAQACGSSILAVRVGAQAVGCI